METIKRFQVIIALIIGLSTVLGTAFALDGRYAKEDSVKAVQEEIQKVEQRLDYKILKDRSYTLEERIWKYQDRYDGREMPDDIKEVIRDLEKDLDEVQEQIEDLSKKDSP